MGGRWPPIIGTQRDTRTGPRLSVGLHLGGRSELCAGGEGAGGANNKKEAPTPTPDRVVQPAPPPPPPSPERPPHVKRGQGIKLWDFVEGEGRGEAATLVTAVTGLRININNNIILLFI